MTTINDRDGRPTRPPLTHQPGLDRIHGDDDDQRQHQRPYQPCHGANAGHGDHHRGRRQQDDQRPRDRGGPGKPDTAGRARADSRRRVVEFAHVIHSSDRCVLASRYVAANGASRASAAPAAAGDRTAAARILEEALMTGHRAMLLAGIIGLVNSFRMMRLPDPTSRVHFPHLHDPPCAATRAHPTPPCIGFLRRAPRRTAS